MAVGFGLWVMSYGLWVMSWGRNQGVKTINDGICDGSLINPEGMTGLYFRDKSCRTNPLPLPQIKTTDYGITGFFV